jgi:AcrR family transcriptional regulator
MSFIARKVGGSKTTLWNHFAGKEQLFAAVVDTVVEENATILSVELSLGVPIEEVLLGFGRALLASIYAPRLLALHRLVVGEAQRFPQVASIFYERGPSCGKRRLTHYLQEQQRMGTLRPGNCARLADEFGSLCQAEHLHPVLLGLRAPPEADEREVSARNAVDSFCRAWKS